MANKPIDTRLLDKAIIFAVKAHAGTERRGKGYPYIVHPLEAVSIVATMTADQELLAAAALHDVVEDTAVTVDEIRREFGDRVADLVAFESDSEGNSDASNWMARKQAGLDKLRRGTREELMVAMGDKLSNMRAIAQDSAVLGDAFWERFHVKDKALHAWRYRALVEAFAPLSDTFAYRELAALVQQVFPQ
ncbi:MAG: bifunctional (p)ppGpp synthetase/guanosine-3',5'-bis(diphosphate) 3'-pyrophosphohydrolase [Bacteroidales bacterium]|nr:bifunctional (p)ppGpp synthetase/guanosine-3',5'-bis(diphosphate) 3'-pyrophosphohydrolase [Bacteroidales bacterium]